MSFGGNYFGGAYFGQSYGATVALIVTIHIAGLDIYATGTAGRDVNPATVAGLMIYASVMAGVDTRAALAGLSGRNADSGIDIYQTSPAGVDDAI